MLSGLPSIFGKEFVIGYFLPATAFLVALFGLLGLFGLTDLVAALSTKNAALDLGLATLATWLLSVALAALNREFIRILEGYGSGNPLKLLLGRQQARYRALCERADDAKRRRKEYQARQEELPATLRNEIIDTRWQLALYFPHDGAFLLPTAFGNAIRAFETYSFAIYGVDSIGAWPRLLAVIPKDYQAIVEAAKARVDFWVNLCVLSGLFVVLFVLATVLAHFGWLDESAAGWIGLLWVPVIAAGLAWFALWRATGAAVQWGECIKAAFDVFLPALIDKLGYERAKVEAAPAAFWQNINNTFVYRLAKDMSAYRKGADAQAKTPAKIKAKKTTKRKSQASGKSKAPA